jgi:hypothetical protein
MRDIPARLAFAHIRLAQAPQALTTLESGRAQLLREALERSRRDLERLAEIGQQDLLARYRALDERMETLQRLAAAGNRPPDWLAQMEQAQAEWNAVIEEIRRLPGYETFLRSLTAEQIQAQAQDAPLVYLAATPHGGFALLVRDQGEPMVVELPQLTEERLQKQVLGFSAKEYETLQQQAYKENRQPPSQPNCLAATWAPTSAGGSRSVRELPKLSRKRPVRPGSRPSSPPCAGWARPSWGRCWRRWRPSCRRGAWCVWCRAAGSPCSRCTPRF